MHLTISLKTGEAGGKINRAYVRKREWSQSKCALLCHVKLCDFMSVEVTLKYIFRTQFLLLLIFDQQSLRI